MAQSHPPSHDACDWSNNNEGEIQMKKRLVVLAAALAMGFAAKAALAQAPVIDGTADGAYGAALSVQNTNTQFGNAGNGDQINGGGGSEIDQVFAKISGGRLYVFVAGNLETNFNKLEVFIDSEAGGVNSISGAALPAGVDPFCCGGFAPPDGGNTNNTGALQRMQGLTFDAGFDADHYLTFAAGFETVSPNTPESLTFFALTSHYADLTDGVSGRKGALGMQLAQRGLPNVLRGTTADFDIDGDADGADFLIWQRNVNLVEANAPNRLVGNADGDDNPDPNVTNRDVDGDDLNIIKAAYGFQNTTATFGANYFAPQSQGIDNSNVLLGPALPGLSQGDLIDKIYALGPNGGATDNAGTGAVTRELEFSLPPIAGTTNAASHRNMDNIVDLQMALNNSNTAGVTGDAPYTSPATGNPADVVTGIEFSIPLSEIGNPAGPVKIFAFINGGGHDYAANQFSGAGILDANLGGNGFGGFTGDLSGVNMTDFAGDQFVTVSPPVATAVPEPGAVALASVALLSLGAIVRRQRAASAA